ncbi:MAG: UDP-2,4-diacetamido-2,4,6-trideoxy-beta-L-altropyranose hydrolase [Methanobacteriota archaeon]|nr:MAG: UDP-2,4-diacetamido-2,4,6-trideoxy-beta-L-altropyranose hydrolase [Euryarchaeota archaeon]
MSMDREALEGEVLGRVMMVRADASRAMGTGHVMRCLALCQAWSDLGGRAVFHTAPTGSRLEELLRREGVEISYAEHSAGDEDDASELMAKAQNADSSWIVQDGYHLRVDYQRRLKGSGLPLLAIDDLAEERRHSADIVLNQNMYASAEDYRPSGPETRLLLGPNYALLRRDFWRFRGRERRTGEVEHVLISFGGSDPRDLTGMALRALADVEGSPEVRAMVGPLNSRADELRSQAERTALDAEVLVGVQSMAEMLDWADLVVAAAGSSVYEFAFMGVPALMVQVADNQRLGAAAMAAKGLAVNLGWHEDITIEGLRNAMTRAIGDYEARRSMARAGQSVVDSLGAFRTVAAMMSR